MGVIQDALSEYVALDGSYFGLTIPKNRDVAFNVRFWPLIQEMIDRGYFTAPTNPTPLGWATGVCVRAPKQKTRLFRIASWQICT